MNHLHLADHASRFYDLIDLPAAAVLAHPDTCSDWTGALTPEGWPIVRIAGRAVSAHEVAYQLEHGPVPVGRVPRCPKSATCLRGVHLVLVDPHAPYLPKLVRHRPGPADDYQPRPEITQAADHFRSLVDKPLGLFDPGYWDTCQEWRGPINPRTGWRYFLSRCRRWPARVFAYELEVGPLYPDLVVVARCGNRGCMFGAHLDLQRNHPDRGLDPGTRESICELYRGPLGAWQTRPTQRELAVRFRVSRDVIARVLAE